MDGAKILAQPPEQGSWKLTAKVVLIGGTLYTLGTTSKDTAIGHLVVSAYDYVISETLGFHVDFEKTLGQQYDELQRNAPAAKELPQPKFDALLEKCEVAVREMHRPIVWSQTAVRGEVIARVNDEKVPIKANLTSRTYDYLHYTETSKRPREFTGRVSSYNINTYKGRVYIEQFQRPIAFELAPDARGARSIATVVESLSLNARHRDRGEIRFSAFLRTSRSGQLKGLYIVEISR